MHTAETLIPPSYPALEAEVYQSLDFVTERPTLIPDQFEAEELVAESVR